MDDDDGFYDGPDGLENESYDSNGIFHLYRIAEDNPLNEYPDEETSSAVMKRKLRAGPLLIYQKKIKVQLPLMNFQDLKGQETKISLKTRFMALMIMSMMMKMMMSKFIISFLIHIAKFLLLLDIKKRSM